jgi:peptidyl-prolyl cis-trans isomerase D
MFAAIRAFAKSWVAAVLIGLLIVSFAVFGLSDVFKAKISDSVVSAGSRQVSAADFKRMFENYKRQAEQRSGQQISNEDAVKRGLDERVLNEIADNEALAELINRSGIKPSDKMVGKEISKTTAFFDPITGKFDERSYQQKLAENQLTPAKFETYLRDELAQSQYAAGIVAGLRAPRLYGALIAAFGLENRDISYFNVNPGMVAPMAPPTDAQLSAFIKENSAQLMSPETRALTIVRFSTKALMPSVTINPADLEKLYAFKKDTLSTPEKRSLVQIPAKDAIQAAAIASRLGKGEDPAQIAKAYGFEPVVYDAAPKTAIVDPKIAEAAFGLKEGQVSGPVQGTLGLGVVKITRIVPGQTVALEAIRPQLEQQLRGDAAAQKVYDLTQKYEDAHTAGASLEEAAQKAGVTALSIAPVSPRGTTRLGQPVPGLSERLLRAAFALPEGGESDVEDEGSGEYYAVKVDKIVAPALPSVDDIRQPLTRVYMTREMTRRLQARADELVARIKKGERLEAVAASAGGKVGNAVGLDRATAGGNRTLSGEILNKMFSAKQGEVVTGQDVQFGIVVARLNTIRPGDAAQSARIAEGQRPQVTIQMFDEIGQLSRKAARSITKVKLDTARAKTALGVTPPDPKTAKAVVDDTKTPEKAK